MKYFVKIEKDTSGKTFGFNITSEINEVEYQMDGFDTEEDALKELNYLKGMFYNLEVLLTK
jgi:hypothetical protein